MRASLLNARRRPTAAVALLLAWLPTVLCGCGTEAQAAEREVSVFAAASLRDVTRDLGAAFEAEHGVDVTFNLAGSNTLARQIVAAPRRADVFVAADEAWVDHVGERGLLAAGSKTECATNRLVIVARHDAAHRALSPADLARDDHDHLAMADPEAVPAGRYARAWLSTLPHGDATVWDAVRGRVVPTADVRAALALVGADRRTLGIVYRTDAAASERVRVVHTAGEGAPDVRYFAACTEAGDGATFVRWLTGPTAVAVWQRHGFGTPEAGGR